LIEEENKKKSFRELSWEKYEEVDVHIFKEQIDSRTYFKRR
jgi:hypothetical protein